MKLAIASGKGGTGKTTISTNLSVTIVRHNRTAPGTACPMIETVKDCDYVVLVTEPTPFGLHDLRLAVGVARALNRPSGEHDLERVLTLARHFGIPAWVCVNKYDLNPATTARLEFHAAGLGATVVGRIPYDPTLTAAQRQGRTILECDPGSPAAVAVTQLWERIKPEILSNGAPPVQTKCPN